MKLAFVIPWFGFDIPGGAESVCRSTALQLHEHGVPVEILTTCIKELRSDWGRNYHPPGVEISHGIPIRRFPVEPRDEGEFARLNQRLLAGLPITSDEERVFIREMLRCDDLFEYLREHQDQYVYAFLPYLFATTYWGTLACPERAILIPCLHDESYAHLGIYRDVFETARGVILHSPRERELCQRLFPMRPGAAVLVGGGVQTDFEANGPRFKKKYALDRYLLYAGRKDKEKNVPLLVEYFQFYKEAYGTDLKLVLIGDGTVSIPEECAEEILDLGFVSAQDKYDAYAGALALCQPSLNESFSLVLMEAWSARTPALVHEGCAVTHDHCLASSGGLYFSSAEDFAGCLDFLLDHPSLARRLGENGQRYVAANFSWDRIVRKYREAFHAWGFDL